MGRGGDERESRGGRSEERGGEGREWEERRDKKGEKVGDWSKNGKETERENTC